MLRSTIVGVACAAVTRRPSAATPVVHIARTFSSDRSPTPTPPPTPLTNRKVPPSVYDSFAGLSSFATRVQNRIPLFEHYQSHNVFQPDMWLVDRYLLFSRLQMPAQTQVDPVEFLESAPYAIKLALYSLCSTKVLPAVEKVKLAEKLKQFTTPSGFARFGDGLIYLVRKEEEEVGSAKMKLGRPATRRKSGRPATRRKSRRLAMKSNSARRGSTSVRFVMWSGRKSQSPRSSGSEEDVGPASDEEEFGMTWIDIGSVHIADVEWEKLTVADVKREDIDVMRWWQEDRVYNPAPAPETPQIVALREFLNPDSIIVEKVDEDTFIERLRITVIATLQLGTHESKLYFEFVSNVSTPDDVEWRINLIGR